MRGRARVIGAVVGLLAITSAAQAMSNESQGDGARPAVRLDASYGVRSLGCHEEIKPATALQASEPAPKDPRCFAVGGFSCPEPGEMHATSLLGDPADIESAVSCWKPNSADTRPWRGTTRVPEAKLDFLLHDLATHTRSQKDMGEPECPGGRGGYYWQDIVGWTRWGDLVVIGGVCREFRAAPNAFRIVGPTENVDTTAPFWHPSARGQRILDGLRR